MGVLSASNCFSSDSLPLQSWRWKRGSYSFAAAIIFCSALRSFGDKGAVFAIITVGAKRRIFAASELADSFVWAFVCGDKAVMTVNKRAIEVSCLQTFILIL